MRDLRKRNSSGAAQIEHIIKRVPTLTFLDVRGTTQNTTGIITQETIRITLEA